jgi:hypothetical protein
MRRFHSNTAAAVATHPWEFTAAVAATTVMLQLPRPTIITSSPSTTRQPVKYSFCLANNQMTSWFYA